MNKEELQNAQEVLKQLKDTFDAAKVRAFDNRIDFFVSKAPDFLKKLAPGFEDEQYDHYLEVYKVKLSAAFYAADGNINPMSVPMILGEVSRMMRALD